MAAPGRTQPRDLAQRVDLRPAQLIRFATGVRVAQGGHHRLHHIAHIDRLHAHVRARQRQHGQPARQRGKHIGEFVVRPK
ncbi:hypothetical protein G6F35_018824 [Rhizopus arrhizus]|nr:hypothetical protein G6F35_018824 [Rhizopus arrhizus]KAG1372903.1 hypothetical protein G6F59_018546 [Rhizopus arrhizus]